MGLDLKDIILNGPLWQVCLVVAFAGVLVSLSSCTIARIPLMLGCVNSSNANQKRSFQLALAFSAGLILSYTVIGLLLGAIAQLAGKMIGISQFLYTAFGVMLIFSGIFFAGLFPKSLEWFHNHCEITIKRINTIPATFAFGAVFAFLEMPACAGCGAGMMLITTLVTIKGSIWYSAIVFAAFAIGQSLPILALGASATLLHKVAPIFERFEGIISFIIGNILIVTGVFLIFIA